jgi:hypothetical protein
MSRCGWQETRDTMQVQPRPRKRGAIAPIRGSQWPTKRLCSLRGGSPSRKSESQDRSRPCSAAQGPRDSQRSQPGLLRPQPRGAMRQGEGAQARTGGPDPRAGQPMAAHGGRQTQDRRGPIPPTSNPVVDAVHGYGRVPGQATGALREQVSVVWRRVHEHTRRSPAVLGPRRPSLTWRNGLKREHDPAVPVMQFIQAPADIRAMEGAAVHPA